MEAVIQTRAEFIRRYWDYYLILEKDFFETERYVAIDKINFATYSNEYSKQYQTICSEIDVISKSYCRAIDNQFRGEVIDAYCKCITDADASFSGQTIEVQNRNIKLSPWANWTYSIQTGTSGKTHLKAINPIWWTTYNKIKHARTTINSATNLQYYQLANQENVLNALAGLFQIEMFYYKKLWTDFFQDDPDILDCPSRYFKMENWESNYGTFRDAIFEISHEE